VRISTITAARSNTDVRWFRGSADVSALLKDRGSSQSCGKQSYIVCRLSFSLPLHALSSHSVPAFWQRYQNFVHSLSLYLKSWKQKGMFWIGNASDEGEIFDKFNNRVLSSE
jgi:hypothetical protein